MATFIAFLALFVLLWPRTTKGTITARSGNTYPYELGMQMRQDNHAFNGIEVSLPKSLPRIYLDNLVGSAIRGPSVTYKNHQRLELEGDFNKNFQLFVAEKSRVLALSILTPDVMQTLMQLDQKCDVEIGGRYLRLIVRGRFAQGSQRGQEILQSAEQIIEEIDHKLRSWTREDEIEGGAVQLEAYDDEAIRIGGRYIGVGRLALVISSIVILIMSALALYFNGRNPGLSDAFIFLVIGFAVVPFILFFGRTKL